MLVRVQGIVLSAYHITVHAYKNRSHGVMFYTADQISGAQFTYADMQPADHSTLVFTLQITSLFMHISPALVCWAWRWYPDPSVVKFDEMSAEKLKAYNTASWWDIGVLSMSSYMVWVVLYYLKVSAAVHTCSLCHGTHLLGIKPFSIVKGLVVLFVCASRELHHK